MVNEEPVNLKHQTIFTLIPYLNLYAFYRVQKLRRYFLISIAIFLTSLSIFVGITIGMIMRDGSTEESFLIYQENMEFLKSPPMYITSFIGGGLLNVYLIRRWSKQWNERISNNIHEETKLASRSTKKIIVGTGIGLGILVFIILGIIGFTTTDLLSNASTPDVEFGYYQMGDIIELGGLRILVTTTFTSIGNSPNFADDTFFIVGIQSYNRYDEKTVPYMVNEFTLIDGVGKEFNPVYFSSDEYYDLRGFEEIQPRSAITRFVAFDIPFDPSMKYELKLGNVGLVCLRNC